MRSTVRRPSCVGCGCRWRSGQRGVAPGRRTSPPLMRSMRDKSPSNTGTLNHKTVQSAIVHIGSPWTTNCRGPTWTSTTRPSRGACNSTVGRRSGCSYGSAGRNGNSSCTSSYAARAFQCFLGRTLSLPASGPVLASSRDAVVVRLGCFHRCQRLSQHRVGFFFQDDQLASSCGARMVCRCPVVGPP